MMLYVPWIVAVVASATGAATDLRTRRIPNVLTGAVLLGGILWAVFSGGGIGSALGGAAIAGGPFILLWLLGGGGAGDAKMMLALGAWVGPAGALPLVLAVGVVGGVVSLVYGLSRRAAGTIGSDFFALLLSLPLVLAGVRGSDGRRVLATTGCSERVPYGVAIFGGVCAALTWVMLWRS